MPGAELPHLLDEASLVSCESCGCRVGELARDDGQPRGAEADLVLELFGRLLSASACDCVSEERVGRRCGVAETLGARPSLLVRLPHAAVGAWALVPAPTWAAGMGGEGRTVPEAPPPTPLPRRRPRKEPCRTGGGTTRAGRSEFGGGGSCCAARGCVGLALRSGVDVATSSLAISPKPSRPGTSLATPPSDVAPCTGAAGCMPSGSADGRPPIKDGVATSDFVISSNPSKPSKSAPLRAGDAAPDVQKSSVGVAAVAYEPEPTSSGSPSPICLWRERIADRMPSKYTHNRAAWKATSSGTSSPSLT